MPIGNRNWKSAGALIALVLMMFTTAVIPEIAANTQNSYAASTSAAETADERKNETSLTNELYARAAVLMDAENGRILFSKNGDEVLPMASTTKIMTCVLALETGNPEDVLPVSSYAARQPKVHMGVQKGEYYRMEDLLYGLMLESYNDAAVVIAEYYGSKAAGLSMDCSLHTEEESRKAVLTFARKMNEKQRKSAVRTRFLSRRTDWTQSLKQTAHKNSIPVRRQTSPLSCATVRLCLLKRKRFLQLRGRLPGSFTA